MSFNNKVSGGKGGSPQRCNDCCYEDSNTLSIIEEFKHLYEEKMRIIDKEGKGDGTMQAKLSLQQDWISDLTEQNEMLVRAVEELEQEATDRVLALEAKLAESSKSASEVMNGYKDISFNLDETFQQMIGLQNDVKNLIQLIHRLQDEGVWNLDGLQFCTVDKNTLVRSNKIVSNSFLDEKHGKIVQEKNEIIKHLEREICELNKCQNTRGYETLKQSMLDMRDALTAEVADKHDSIVTLKRDVQVLEEQCRKADQQTHFKDDIIKELRKEIKQAKHENKNLYTQPIRPKSHSPIHKPPAEPNPNNTYSSEKRFAKVSCPIKSHKTLEKYKDFNNRVVIFVCEDQEQHEMHRLIDGDKMEVIYKNPKIVHEYEADALKKLHKDNTHVVGEGSKIYYTNAMDAPEKLSNRNESNLQQSKTDHTLKDLYMHSTDCKKEVVTSESTAATSSIICQHPPSIVEKAESDKMCSQAHCFTCVIECPACANTHRHFKDTDFERSVGIREDIAQTIIKDKLSPVSKFTTSVSHYKSSQLHMRLINDIERMVAKDRKSVPGKSKSLNIAALFKKNNILYLYNKRLEKNNEETNKQLLELQRENEELQASIMKATTEFENFERITEESLIDKNKIQDTNKTLQAELDQLKCENEKLKEDCEKLMEESCHIKGIIRDNQELRHNYDIRINSLQCQLEKAKTDYQAVANDLSSLKLESYNQCSVIETLQQRIKDDVSQCSSKPVTISAACSPTYPGTPRNRSPNRAERIEYQEHVDGEIDSDYYEVKVVKEVNKNFSLDSGQPSAVESGLKPEALILEGAVHDLKDSVSRIMGRESESKQAKKRIAELEQQLQRISKKDEMIGIQNDTLTIVEHELQAWRAKEQEVEEARCCREREISNLKEVIENLVRSLDTEKKRSENLQQSVEQQVDSIYTLQDLEKQFKKEISDQRLTINNLQEALVATKLNLEEQQQKATHEMSQKIEVIDKLKSLVERADQKLGFYLEKCSSFAKLAESLRDENLSLEVELFYNAQDLGTLETRSLKYQQLHKELQTKCGNLETELLEDRRLQHTAFVDDLSGQLAGCQAELKHLFEVLNEEQHIMEDESVSLTNHVMSLQTEIFNLSQRLAYAMKCLDVEKKNNNVLQTELAKRECELNCAKHEASLLNEKFLFTKKQAEMYYSKSTALEDRMRTYEESINSLDKESKICQNKLGVCMENFKRTQDSLRMKCKDFDELKERYTEQAKAFQQLQAHKDDNEEEAVKYKESVISLNAKVSAAENRCELLQNEMTALRTKLSMSEENEEKLSRDYCACESQLKNQQNVYETEQKRLISIIGNLEQRLQASNCQLGAHEENLKKMKAEISSSRNNGKQIQMKEEECCRLKSELNGLLKKHTQMKTENDVLQREILKLRTIVSQNEDNGKVIVQELQQCLTDLQVIQSEKTYLMQKNEELMQQMQSLQNTCQNKTESVVNLEMELNDTRCMKDTLCNESRTVINNVKDWLQEQRRINMELSNKMRHKNDIITKLNYEKSILENKIKTIMSQCYNSNDYKGSREGPNMSCQYRNSSPPPTKVLWSLGSNGSPCCSSDSDWETTDNNGSSPQVWLHRVESMTEQVQESSRYFKTRLSDRDYTVSKDK